MTEERIQALTVAAFTSIAGTGFGLWQNSIGAGLWMWVMLMMFNKLAEAIALAGGSR